MGTTQIASTRHGLLLLLTLGFALIPLQPAKAIRPLMRTALAINQIRLSVPTPFDNVFTSDTLGLDQEDESLRLILMKQAAEYIELRHSHPSSATLHAWLERCNHPKKEQVRGSDNPFCLYEAERAEKTDQENSHVNRGKNSRRAEKHAIASDLRAGKFSAVTGRQMSDVVGGVAILEHEGTLPQTAMRVADLKECVPSSVSTALAYKLEERFPALESIELAKRLYRKSVSCAQDAPAAQASFRLGLIQIWHDDCSEIPQLMQKVEATPEAAQYHARAKYWRYYCAAKTGDEAAKQVAKNSLLKDHPMSFQALVATSGEDGSIAVTLKTEAPPVAFRSIVRTDLNPALRAAEALIKSGESTLANEILERKVHDLGTIEPEVRLYVAVVLNRLGQTLTKFKILTELFQDAPQMVSLPTLRLFFPLAYYDLVRSQKGNVDPLLILSLMRQESAFNKNARSGAGARGLMQVMPRTARMIASVRSSANLFDPSVNIGVGTKYFVKRLAQYDGDVELTLAAYNAGFARVDEWRKRYPTDNRHLFLDFIPFRETRDYVSTILRNYYWYVQLYSPESQKATASTSALEQHTLRNHDAKTLAIVSANAGAAAAPLNEVKLQDKGKD